MQENLLDLKYLNRNGDSMHGPLLLAGDARQSSEATSKRYVDTVLANLRVQAFLLDGSRAMTGPLVLSGPPILPLHATTKGYVDAADALRVLLAGDTMTGPLTLPGAPVNALHAATKDYVDAADALRLLLGGGTMIGVLTLAADPVLAMQAATMQYVDAVPPGQPIYDAVVDAGGGFDYTSIVTACATEAAGAKIYVVRGTYNEAANIVMKDGQMLEGQNPEDTIIDFGAANRKLTIDGAGTNRSVKNLTLQNSIANYTVEMNGTYDRVENCRLVGSAAAGIGIGMSGLYSIVKDCYVASFSAVGEYGIKLIGSYGIAVNNTVVSCRTGIDIQGAWCAAIGNRMSAQTFQEIETSTHSQVVGNLLYSAGSPLLVVASEAVITGNSIRCGISITGAVDAVVISSNNFFACAIVGTNAASDGFVINNNLFNTGAGISWAGMRSTINGNTFIGTPNLELTANSKWNNVIGNNFDGSTEANATRLDDLGMQGNMAMNNLGIPHPQEKRFIEAQNFSGGGVVDGDVGVHDAEASGNRIINTVNQGDDMVAGVWNEAVANGAWGPLQTTGKMVTLKVNGVVNIAIGDLLGTFTAAGISMKAAAGDMAFAIALEAYAGADSNGIIDALLVSPRKI